jgi:DNA-binding transcriptional ArsR family regulator
MAGPKKAPSQESVMVLTDLEQVRVLADPLRVRILEALCLEERTTKQVAERIGEKPTKLYHHVEALERVGLVRRTRTRPNRGTVEKYYRSVARRFEADSRLFGQGAKPGSDKGALGDMIAQLLARTGDELRRLASSDAASAIQDSGVLTFCEIHAGERQMASIRRRIRRLVEDLSRLDGQSEPGGHERRARLTLAFYPLDR